MFDVTLLELRDMGELGWSVDKNLYRLLVGAEFLCPFNVLISGSAMIQLMEVDWKLIL